MSSMLANGGLAHGSLVNSLVDVDDIPEQIAPTAPSRSGRADRSNAWDDASERPAPSECRHIPTIPTAPAPVLHDAHVASISAASSSLNDALAGEFSRLQAWLSSNLADRLRQVQERLVAQRKDFCIQLREARSHHPEDLQPEASLIEPLPGRADEFSAVLPVAPPELSSMPLASIPLSSMPPSMASRDSFGSAGTASVKTTGPVGGARLASATQNFVLEPIWMEEIHIGLAEGRDIGDSDTESNISGVHGIIKPKWGRKSSFVDNGLAGDLAAQMVSSEFIVFKRCMMNPMSKRRVAWDVFGAVLIFYDMVMIPLQVFPLGQSLFLRFMAWVVVLFWTTDLLSSFCTGTYNSKHNTVEMRPGPVALQYMRTWFLIDSLAVLPDWLVVVIRVEQSGASRMTKALRIIRVMRVLRLLRLAKLRRFVQLLEILLDNEFFVCYLSLGKLMVGVLVLAHLIACGWYAVSQTEDDQKGWVSRGGFDADDGVYCYLTSMHWALSNFNGEVDVVAGTTMERCFTVVVLYIGLLVFSYFVSSITHVLLQIRQLGEDSNQKQWRLMRYLYDNNVSSDLSVRIKLFVEKVTQTTRAQEEDIPLLDILPSGLRRMLDQEIKGPALAVHPLLHHITHEREIVGMRLCQLIQYISLHYGEGLFYQDMTCDGLFLVTVGPLTYAKNLKAQIDALKAGKDIAAAPNLAVDSAPRCEAGDWLSEMGLWTRWAHKGDCHACAHCCVFSLRASDLTSVIPMLSMHSWHVAKHAFKFVRYMNRDPTAIDDLACLPIKREVSMKHDKSTKSKKERRISAWVGHASSA